MTAKKTKTAKPEKLEKTTTRRKSAVIAMAATEIIQPEMPTILKLGDILQYDGKIPMVLIKIMYAKGDDRTRDKYIFTICPEKPMMIALRQADNVALAITNRFGETKNPGRWISPTKELGLLLRNSTGYLLDSMSVDNREFLLMEKTDKGLPQTMNLMSGKMNECLPRGEVGLRPIACFRQDELVKTCTFIQHRKIPESHGPLVRDRIPGPYIMK